MAATSLLSEMGDDPDLLIELAKDANDRQYQILFPALINDRATSSLAMRKELAKSPGTRHRRGQTAIGQRKAHAAITLLRLGEPEVVWPVLGASPDPRGCGRC